MAHLLLLVRQIFPNRTYPKTLSSALFEQRLGIALSD